MADILQKTGASSPQVHGLYEPPMVAFSFDTIGWKILAAILLVLLLSWLAYRIHRYVINRYRQVAIAALERLPEEKQTLDLWLVTLKSVAINVFGRKEVASLQGRAWLDFLESTGKEVQFVKFEKEIAKQVYQNKPPDQQMKAQIIDNAKKWIKTHARKF